MSATTAQHHELPEPLVKPLKHPLKWLFQAIVMLLLGIILVKIGTFIVISLYYFIVGANGTAFGGYTAPLRGPWHDLVPNDNTRHMIRNVGEGVMGGVLGQLVIWNHYKGMKKRDKLNMLDRIEIKLRIPNVKEEGDRLSGLRLLTFPVLVMIYAIPGFLAGNWAIGEIHKVIVHYAPASTFDPTMDQKIVGFFASFFMARRVMRGMADQMQGYFAARRCKMSPDKPVRPYDPPNFRARCNDMSKAGIKEALDTGKYVPVVLTILVLLGVVLAGLGYYIINYIA